MVTRPLAVSWLFCCLVFPPALAHMQDSTPPFRTVTEQFADIRILRYQVPEFDSLTLKQKQLAYYLSQAALAGRDIMWDQNYQHNLVIRKTLEAIWLHYKGDRKAEAFKQFEVYLKRVWFSNGIHHHYSTDKILPNFDAAYLAHLLSNTPASTLPTKLPLAKFTKWLTPILLDPKIAAKKVCLGGDKDVITCSAVNFYEGLTQAEVEAYFKKLQDPKDATPISYGLNSKKIKKNGKLIEQRYKIGGLYDKALKQVVFWLNKAIGVAENPAQEASLKKLVTYYETGDLKVFDDYNIAWVADTTSDIDVINGFIEVYNDPLGYTGSFESVVHMRDHDATKKFGVLSGQAQWFEDHSPISPDYKRSKATGVSYKVVNVIQESGDSSPNSPIGINLPNSNWIRAQHGSKSVSLYNLEHAASLAGKESGALKAFYLPEQQAWLEQYGDIEARIHTGLHEVIGHASGKLLPGITSEMLKNYASALEEARADLVALYFIGDPHLVELGVSPSVDIMKATYTRYINNGILIQSARIEPGKTVEEAHMRNRFMIAQWVYEKGRADNVIEQRDIETPEGVNTYFVVNDFNKLRTLFGQLLAEVQRIKSTGDFTAGQALFEKYGIKLDPTLHTQVLRRWAKLGVAPYGGYINPQLTPVLDEQGNIANVTIAYPDDFATQMLMYAKLHSFL